MNNVLNHGEGVEYWRGEDERMMTRRRVPLSRFLFIPGAMAEVVINEDNYLGFASRALYGVISNQ